MSNTSLRVQSSRTRSPRKSTEAQFERKIAKHLDALGIFSYHVSEKSHMGIPDRYVAGGRWIEFKQAAVIHSFTPMRLFSPGQIKFMDRFLEAGDTPYVCILFQFTEDEPLCVLMEWGNFKTGNKKWNRDAIHLYGYVEKEWLEMVNWMLNDG